MGSACDPTIHIKRLNLRKASLPLDWVASLSLSNVSRLLENKFTGYMELDNMRLKDGSAFYLNDGDAIFSDDRFTKPVQSYFVEDTFYNIISVHDFPILPNQDWTATYPSFKEKLNKRVNRFLDLMNTSQSILFVRWFANYHQAAELQSALYKITNGLFHIVIINPVEGLPNVSEVDWGLDRVCSVQVPNRIHDTTIWDYILKGVTLTP
ncbi:papain-like cysteine peptidase [Ectobacillus funiculus]|uniref:DUF1796 family putative cysteine peptidase n=1 Tax=Ectobacillus funiculus TaxID=137993 RepID=UPI00397B7E6B